MGIFNRRLKLPNGQFVPSASDFSPAAMKETLKEFGLEPAESARALFGWTEEDDRDGQRILQERARAELAQRIADGCSLREEMQLEIKIDGMGRQ